MDTERQIVINGSHVSSWPWGMIVSNVDMCEHFPFILLEGLSESEIVVALNFYAVEW